MSEKKQRILAVLVLVVGVAVFFMLMSVLFQGGGKPSPSGEMPSLTLKNLQGQDVNLNDYRGKVVLVNNFAVWCPPCRAEMPELEAYYQENKAQGFEIVAIEAGQPLETVKQFVEGYNLSFAVLLDPQTKALAVFRNSALPNSVLVDREGKIRRTWVGGVDKKFLEEAVTPILKE